MDYITGSSDAAPLSIQEIAKKATDFEYNPLIPLRYWFRTADTLLKEVWLRRLLSVGYEYVLRNVF